MTGTTTVYQKRLQLQLLGEEGVEGGSGRSHHWSFTGS